MKTKSQRSIEDLQNRLYKASVANALLMGNVPNTVIKALEQIKELHDASREAQDLFHILQILRNDIYPKLNALEKKPQLPLLKKISVEDIRKWMRLEHRIVRTDMQNQYIELLDSFQNHLFGQLTVKEESQSQLSEEAITPETLIKKHNDRRYSKNNISVLKTGDRVLTALKKTPDHFTTQLDKENNISYNTGFHAGFILGHLQKELSYTHHPDNADNEERRPVSVRYDTVQEKGVIKEGTVYIEAKFIDAEDNGSYESEMYLDVVIAAIEVKYNCEVNNIYPKDHK